MFLIFKFIYYQVCKQDKYFNKNVDSTSSTRATSSSCPITFMNHAHISSLQHRVHWHGPHCYCVESWRVVLSALTTAREESISVILLNVPEFFSLCPLQQNIPTLPPFWKPGDSKLLTRSCLPIFLRGVLLSTDNCQDSFSRCWNCLWLAFDRKAWHLAWFCDFWVDFEVKGRRENDSIIWKISQVSPLHVLGYPNGRREYLQSDSMNLWFVLEL